jgi:hypothetical protein
MRASILLAGLLGALPCLAQQDAGVVLPALLGDNLQGGSVKLKPLYLLLRVFPWRALTRVLQ